MMSRMSYAFNAIDYKWHLVLSFLLRVILIIYGDFHDRHFVLQYTDVDYKVFTDAARYVLKGGSPYERHTYRYTPLISWLLLPNLLIHPSYGKLLFSVIDIIAAVFIKKIIERCVKYNRHCFEKMGILAETETCSGDATIKENTARVSGVSSENEHSFEIVNNETKSGSGNIAGNDAKLTSKVGTNGRGQVFINDVEFISNFGMFVWLYNPLTIGIATRGNSDSIAGCLVLLTLYLLQCKKLYFLAGVVHGLAIHVRLYPIIYSLAMFLHLSSFSLSPVLMSDEKKVVQRVERPTIFKKRYLFYLIPNTPQRKLIIGCFISLSFLTSLFYKLYGYTFLYESYIYHLVRKDTRHNFSLYFYLQYLTAGVNVGLWQKVLMDLPQLVLVVVLSVRFGLNRVGLNFCIFLLTCVAVIYNAVLTSQYFVWILALLPICFWQIDLSMSSAFLLGFSWVLAQGMWLFSAYLLEFRGFNTFLFIWIYSVAFFCANIAIVAKVAKGFIKKNEVVVICNKIKEQ